MMFANIYKALQEFGLNAQHRALHIQFSNLTLNSQVYLQRIEGQHRLNQGLYAELMCLSTNASIELKQFIGSQVAIDQVTDRGTLFRTTAIVTGVSQGQSDGALTLYKLIVQDPTALWAQRRNSRVFMSKSVLDVISILFKEWQQKSPLFAASLQLDLSGLQQEYDVRPFIMQHNESDATFLQRLMRQEGINWLIDEAELYVASPTASIQAQKLRLVDDNSQYQALTRRSIRFQRSDATEQFDSMTAFVAKRSLQPTAVHLQRWQAEILEHEHGAGSVLSAHRHSAQISNEQLNLEQVWQMSPAWMQDLNGKDQATPSGNSQLEKLNQTLRRHYAAEAKQFIAHTGVRDAQVGYWFELNGHPEIDLHQGQDKQFIIIEKSFYNQNNLPKDLNDQVDQLLRQSQWQSHRDVDQSQRQANTLLLQRRHIATVPAYDPNTHRPIAQTQRAIVVGPSNEEIYVDAWGRIKVRFLFTRSEDHQHDAGAGANDNDTDSAWIDVLTPWAGEGYGARFLARIGEIVVIDFFDGDIDRPFVVGRIHEGSRSPTQFDGIGQLPDTKKLSGIRSQELGGGGFGQLRFDDTTGQISSQLHNSHGASQLNLGNLSHPKNSAESEGRGEGFELRTDQYGAVRAGQGLLLSSHAQDQASAMHLDAAPAKQQLKSNLDSAKALSEVAKRQHTDPLENLSHLQGFIADLDADPSAEGQSKAAQFKQALMLLTAPNSIALSSQQDIHIAADGQVNHTAGDSINLSTQASLIVHASEKVSLFSAQGGIKVVAAKEKVEMQAQDGELDLIARQKLQIISTEDSIYITSPKEIVLTGKDAQVRVNGQGVFFITNQKFESKAGQHVFKGGEKINSKMLNLPSLKCPYKLEQASKNGSAIVKLN